MPTVTRAANAHTVVTTGWTNPSNAFATSGDNVYATAAPGKNATVSGDYGFADFTSSDIPDGATIDAVRIVSEVNLSAVVTGGVYGCQPRVSGANSGTEATKTTTTEEQVTATFGSVTLSDLRSASTVIKARCRGSKGNTTSALTVSLDFVRIEVDYSTPVTAFVDDWNRSVTDGAGTSSDGLITYSTSWAPDTDVDGTKLVLSVPGDGSNVTVTATGYSRQDGEVGHICGFAQLPAGTTWINARVRLVDTSNHYDVRLLADSAAANYQAGLYKNVAGSYSQVGSTVDTGIAKGAGKLVYLVARYVGTAIRVSVGESGFTASWLIDTTDSSVSAAGGTAIHGQNAGATSGQAALVTHTYAGAVGAVPVASRVPYRSGYQQLLAQ